MNNTIKDLYQGNIYQAENCGAANKEIKRLSMQLREVYDTLKALLPKSKWKLLEKFEELSISLSALYNEEFFVEGFALGFKLAVEAIYR